MKSNRTRKLRFCVIVFLLFLLVLFLPRILVEISNLETVQNLCLGPATEESYQGVLGMDFRLDLFGFSQRNTQKERSERLLTFWSDLFIPIFSLGLSIYVFAYERNNELQQSKKAKYDWLIDHFCVEKGKPILLKKIRDKSTEVNTGLYQNNLGNKDDLTTLFVQFPESTELLNDAMIKVRKVTLEVKRASPLVEISTGKMSCSPMGSNSSITSRDLGINYATKEKWIDEFLSEAYEEARLLITLEIDVAFKLTSGCRAYVTYVIGKGLLNDWQQGCYSIYDVDCKLV